MSTKELRKLAGQLSYVYAANRAALVRRALWGLGRCSVCIHSSGLLWAVWPRGRGVCVYRMGLLWVVGCGLVLGVCVHRLTRRGARLGSAGAGAPASDGTAAGEPHGDGVPPELLGV